MAGDPLKGRPDLRVESAEDNPLARELGELLRRHGSDLYGVVLVSFSKELRVGVNSSGSNCLWARAMEELSKRVLADIDDGKYDPTVHLN
jgi:hypothetical protein